MLPQRFFEIELTGKCNLNCIHCRNAAIKTGYLTKSDINKILEKIFDFPSNDKFIALSGGEPLLYPFIKDVIKKIIANNVKVQIVTNGTVITDNFLSFIKHLPNDKLYFAISLDGEREIHNKIRGWSKAFDRTVETIKKLKELNFEVAINFTVNSLNYLQLGFVYNLAVKLNVDVLKVRMPMESGRLSYKDENFSKKEQYLAVMEKALKISEKSFQKDGITIESNDPLWWSFPSVRRDQVLKKISNNNFLGGCSAGWLQLFIDSRGDVYPCAYLPIKFGNAIYSDLCEIIYENISIICDIINREKFEKCGSCKLMLICGGCRARAFSQNGNIFGKDPFCLL